ncbi:MAG: 4'-phosphopantetheinyl transferase superfamily protein [Sphingobacteriaceae bacterium]|nr:MAG: 4'-phosphopantetheinyl transferase superfamily protein [Sphingobacteriaceae bacterium]
MRQLSVQTINVNWINADKKAALINNHVHIWRIKISAFTAELHSLQTLLEVKELQKIERYQHETDRQTRIISRAVLRILLSRYLLIDPAEIRFKLDDYKKPVLQQIDSAGLYFNVSHTGDWILIGIAANSIGVDLEKIDASFIDQNLLEFSCSSAEKIFIQSAANPVESFYQLWTKKEALLKATGKGLTDNLAQVPSLDGIHEVSGLIIGSEENWQMINFEIDEKHTGSTAFIPVKTVVQFINFQL